MSETQAVAETADWSFRLQLVAVADVDDSGMLDWLVWVGDEACAGNYRGYATVLIRDVAETGPLVAEGL